MKSIRQKILLIAVLGMGILTFFTGLNWGLPSREADLVLFGPRQPWTGKQIMDLAGPWEEDGARGADIAMHPLPGQRDQSIVLNDTDSRRAQIVRRFRLYSSQPDEMITFRSLSRMKPGKLDFDPRLYQYGGLWIYPVGMFLKLGAIFNLITLRTDLAFYLDHPESFSRFYVVARAYSAIFGLIGLLTLFCIGREWTGRHSTGITSAGLYAVLPVVIDLAHEAKPHLPGTVLVLVTVWSAMKYVHSGQKRWWLIAGITAGAAMGMVLTGYVAFAVLPVMTLLRRLTWRDRVRITAAAALVGIATFAISNPYLPYHLFFHREVLHSNVGNYGTFYQPQVTAAGIIFAARSILEGLSPGPALIGGLGMLAFIHSMITAKRSQIPKAGSEVPRRAGSSAVEPRSLDHNRTGARGKNQPPVGFLLAAPVTLALIQYVLLASGKTAEYARFALLPDVAIALCAAVLIDRLQFTGREKALGSALLIASALYFGVRYDLNFLADKREDSTRRVAARMVERLKPEAKTLAVWAEPAPYCLPPVDLFHWKILLLPKDSEPTAPDTISIRSVDRSSATPPGATRIIPLVEPARAESPISWANKPFDIMRQ